MKNPFVAMAMMAATLAAAMRENAERDFVKKGGATRNRYRSYSRNHAIPKWARRYSKRYGGTIHHA